MVMKTISLIIIVACILYVPMRSVGSTNISYKYNAERSIIYPDAYNIQVHNSSQHNVWQTDYMVHVAYPSRAVLTFYERRILSLGWQPFAEKDLAASYRVWQTFIDDTQNGHPRVYQLLAKWRKKGMVINLTIRYYSSAKGSHRGPDNDIEHVGLVIMPFFPIATTQPQHAINTRVSWLDSFAVFKKDIRPLTQNGRRACENLLHGILRGIDENSICTTDSDCRIVRQEPFGGVPVTVEKAESLLQQMNIFRASCDNGSMRGGTYGPGVSCAAVCRNGRCLVKNSTE
jgi:hypothetical protein